ncbi:Uncharacterised protein [Bordetella pertussis]|nr:Uncharacterised protein [Bordetella pertussis]CFP59800.1 Uncharacterised protein [Bordetella pertussis]
MGLREMVPGEPGTGGDYLAASTVPTQSPKPMRG